MFFFQSIPFTFVVRIKNNSTKNKCQNCQWAITSLLRVVTITKLTICSGATHCSSEEKGSFTLFRAQALPSSSTALLHTVQIPIILAPCVLPFNSSAIPQILSVLTDEPRIPAELSGLEDYLKGKTNEKCKLWHWFLETANKPNRFGELIFCIAKVWLCIVELLNFFN